MHVRTPSLVASLVAALAFASPARAEAMPAGDVEKSPFDRPISVAVVTGLGTPVGNLGATLEGSPARWLAVGAGVGMAIDGLQQAGHLHLRVPLGPVAVAFGGGLSTGPFRHRPFLCALYDGSCTTWRWDRAYWGNLEIAIEGRSAGGVGVRVFGGAASQIATRATDCFVVPGDPDAKRAGITWQPCEESAMRKTVTVPYLGLSVSYSFGG